VGSDHEIEHDDPLEIREDVTLAPGADVPEEIEERLADEDDEDEDEDGEGKELLGRDCGHDGWVLGCPECEAEHELANALIEAREG
jgi:hypothetical protein